MRVTVNRISNEEQMVEIGTFHDPYHGLLFTKALIDRDNEEEQDGRYLIDYIHGADDEKHSDGV